MEILWRRGKCVLLMIGEVSSLRAKKTEEESLVSVCDGGGRRRGLCRE